jgi:hypothetical protein
LRAEGGIKMYLEAIAVKTNDRNIKNQQSRRLKTGGKAKEALVRRSGAELETDGSERLENTSPEKRRMVEYSEGGRGCPWTVAPRSQSLEAIVLRSVDWINLAQDDKRRALVNTEMNIGDP